MSFFNNFEKPHKWIVIDECPKCKYRFEIKRNADEINLLEIIELIEGRRQEHFCGISEGKCPFESCVFGDLPREFDDKFREYYADRTIGDIKVARKTVNS